MKNEARLITAILVVSYSTAFVLPARTTQNFIVKKSARSVPWLSSEQRMSTVLEPIQKPIDKDDKTEVELKEEETMATQESPDSAEDSIANEKKSYLDDGFVFGLEGSGLERPKGKVATLVVEGDSLETKPYQVALVSATLISHFLFAGHSFLQLIQNNGGNVVVSLVTALAVSLSSYILADFGSGVLHWSVDNYGNGRTPIMGGIIAAFQGHHSAPWTITDRGFCNNVYKLCIPFGIPTMALINLISGPSTTLFYAVFCTMEILSQEFHKWSHTAKGKLPLWVVKLQDLGITVGRQPHALHHSAPYEGYYCIISGICNTFLDKIGFFRRLEHVIYRLNGVESNAWKLDPALKARTLSGDYSWQPISASRV
mmetsp:Transcript_37341/g.57315  ORF Transcript_37341/g.57315 Transcript_37341/m.57315 type:complete len:371 (+) Transcript_37341:42-1154(+)